MMIWIYILTGLLFIWLIYNGRKKEDKLIDKVWEHHPVLAEDRTECLQEFDKFQIKERTGYQIPIMVADSRLNKWSMDRLKEMEDLGVFSHASGHDEFDVIYREGGDGTVEILANNYSRITSAIHGWGKSEAHYRGILNPSSDYYGIAEFIKKDGRKCWCALMVNERTVNQEYETLKINIKIYQE